MTSLLKDSDLREAAHKRLLAHARLRHDTLVIDELGLSHGAARIDIAIINGRIQGVEIKSEADTLERLPRQVQSYGQVVDKATLIVADRHLDLAEQMLPEWWGLIAAVRSRNGSVMFRRLRPERLNRATDPMTLARLMWHNEVAAVLLAMGCRPVLLRAPRAKLYAELVSRVPQSHLAALVRTTLRGRENWRDRQRPL